MGTAGPLALARQELDDGSGEPFFVLNSDVICEYPLKEMLAFHKARNAEGTLLVTKVRESKGGALRSLLPCSSDLSATHHCSSLLLVEGAASVIRLSSRAHQGDAQ